MTDDLASYCRKGRDLARQQAAASGNPYVKARLNGRAEAFDEVLQQVLASRTVRSDLDAGPRRSARDPEGGRSA